MLDFTYFNSKVMPELRRENATLLLGPRMRPGRSCQLSAVRGTDQRQGRLRVVQVLRDELVRVQGSALRIFRVVGNYP